MVSHPETGSDSPIGSDRDRGRDSKCCHMEHFFAACFGPPHLHPQNGGLDMVLLGGQWTGS